MELRSAMRLELTLAKQPIGEFNITGPAQHENDQGQVIGAGFR